MRGTYAADRWPATYGSGDVNWTRESDGCITVAPTNTASHGDLYQKIDPALFSYLVGKICTMSVMMQDGTIYSGTTTILSGSTRTPIEINDIGNGTKLQVSIYPDGRVFLMAFYGSATFKAAKLELGSVSTLMNDVPPDYGTELIKCRGYFERIHSLGSSEIVGMGMGVSASSVRIGIPSLICHTIQSVTYSGGGLLLEGGGNYRTLTSIGKLNATPKNGFLTVTCGSSDAITLYQTYALVGTAAGGYIDISADL
jgi:hypothetical protein